VSTFWSNMLIRTKNRCQPRNVCPFSRVYTDFQMQLLPRIFLFTECSRH
jgi:hypothetical protein